MVKAGEMRKIAGYWKIEFDSLTIDVDRIIIGAQFHSRIFDYGESYKIYLLLSSSKRLSR